MSILVTGASSGFGAAICETLVNAGYRVIGAARRLEKLQALQNELGGNFLPLQMDVGDTASVDQALAALPAVLVVDDEVRSQEALRRTLEEDFTVFTASGADEAMAIMIGTADAAHLAEAEALHASAANLLPPDKVLLLPTRLGNRAGWGVFYGFFPDRPTAKQALAALPTNLRKGKPFVRTITGIKNEQSSSAREL